MFFFNSKIVLKHSTSIFRYRNETFWLSLPTLFSNRSALVSIQETSSTRTDGFTAKSGKEERGKRIDRDITLTFWLLLSLLVAN